MDDNSGVSTQNPSSLVLYMSLTLDIKVSIQLPDPRHGGHYDSTTTLGTRHRCNTQKSTQVHRTLGSLGLERRSCGADTKNFTSQDEVLHIK